MSCSKGWFGRDTEVLIKLVDKCNENVGVEVGFAEVEHWMWRMFIDDYGSVCEALGLPLLPFSLDQRGVLPSPTPLLYGLSPSVLPRQPWWPDR